jgi:hypothetical protein
LVNIQRIQPPRAFGSMITSLISNMGGTGYLEAMFFTAYLQMRKKVPDRSDELEIKKTIALHSREIKKLLSKRKTLG